MSYIYVPFYDSLNHGLFLSCTKRRVFSEKATDVRAAKCNYILI